MQRDMQEYSESVYAGVLGKIIGVYLGRPVEGWPYEKIRSRFGNIREYINREVGVPLVVADDDVSGTFVFFNALEDAPDPAAVTAADFGRAWLDYLIEEKTILWWGGLGRSTEHTAFLRLKQGIEAPYSGSMALNGQGVSEQIGAQIFIDAIAMTCPGDPARAIDLVGKAASVSHDGIAVASACFLAAAEALAFNGGAADSILDRAASMIDYAPFRAVYDDVRSHCAAHTDWRQVRDWLDEHYGYHLYPGNCHVVPNLSLILASILLGGDSFAKSLEIAVSGGWDTDCNAANIGCFNGIRLGLSAITSQVDYRGPVADRLYAVSSDGGRCVSDAVLQTRRIVDIHRRLYRLQAQPTRARFAFEAPGSVQGFVRCPVVEGDAGVIVRNADARTGESGLEIAFLTGRSCVSTPTFWDCRDKQANYCLIGSPTLYAGQTVEMKLYNPDAMPRAIAPYIVHYDLYNRFVAVFGQTEILSAKAEKCLAWQIPDTNGMPIARIGLQVEADVADQTDICKTAWSGQGNAASPATKQVDCAQVATGQTGRYSVILRALDWDGAPQHFALQGPYRNDDMVEPPMVMQAFTASARQFSFDGCAACCVSHPAPGGAATLGTEQWRDYRVSATISLSIHQSGGILARCRGHRRYYAALLCGGNTLRLVRRESGAETVLAQTHFHYLRDEKHRLELQCKGNIIRCFADSGAELVVEDDAFSCGGAGFVIDSGTLMADNLQINDI